MTPVPIALHIPVCHLSDFFGPRIYSWYPFCPCFRVLAYISLLRDTFVHFIYPLSFLGRVYTNYTSLLNAFVIIMRTLLLPALLQNGPLKSTCILWFGNFVASCAVPVARRYPALSPCSLLPRLLLRVLTHPCLCLASNAVLGLNTPIGSPHAALCAD